jgi:transposase
LVNLGYALHHSTYPEQKQALEEGYKKGKSHSFRNRCQAILLSHQGHSVQQLARVFQVRDLSIYKWMNRFEDGGVKGLQNQPGRGRKALLKLENQFHVQVVEAQIEQQNQRVKLAKEQIEKQLGHSLSESTLKRFLKKVATSGNASANG